MTLHKPAITLDYDEASIIGLDMARVWVGLTGLTSIPPNETLADLVQWTMRKANEQVALQTVADICNLHWPDEPAVYHSMGKQVLLGDSHVADAADNDLAERIAAALQREAV